MHGFNEVKPIFLGRIGDNIRKLAVGNVEKLKGLESFALQVEILVGGVAQVQYLCFMSVAGQEFFHDCFMKLVVRARAEGKLKAPPGSVTGTCSRDRVLAS